MSRTCKGSKGPGHEYWGKRYTKHEAYGRWPGKYAKVLTHRYERRETKELTDVEDIYPFSCLHPDPETWQGDLRNG